MGDGQECRSQPARSNNKDTTRETSRDKRQSQAFSRTMNLESRSFQDDATCR